MRETPKGLENAAGAVNVEGCVYKATTYLGEIFQI
jgi:hypothetical protein